MIFFTTLLATDFGKMRKFEKACESGNYKYEEVEETKVEINNTGKLPVTFKCDRKLSIKNTEAG